MGWSEKVKRLLFFPCPGHLYNQMFRQALETHGILEEPGGEFTNEALRAQAKRVDGIHFHFVQQLWPDGAFGASLMGLVGTVRYCRLAKQLGLRLIWTVHDLPGERQTLKPWQWLETAWRRPLVVDHTDERTRGKVNEWGFRFFAHNADLIIVHSQSALETLRGKYGPLKNTIQMPHGNFVGFLQANQSVDNTRQAFGLKLTMPVLGMVGRIQASRGHLLALDAMPLLKDQVQLLIVGRAADVEYARELGRRAQEIPGVVFQSGRLDDMSYANAITACDLILLPYSDITTSGALLSAWTFSRAVIMSDLPLFRELAPSNPAAGIIMAQRTPKALAEAVQALLALPPQHREQAVGTERSRYDWDKIVVPVANALQNLLDHPKHSKNND